MSAAAETGFEIRDFVAADLEAVRQLFQEYEKSVGFSLCFQSFDQELASLPGKYAPPHGALLVATKNAQYAGCVSLRPLDLEHGICEMKRLYLRPAFRGSGRGRNLALGIIERARQLGYSAMRLDTVAGVMDDAIALYRRLGFREIAPYVNNPIAGALYMELALA